MRSLTAAEAELHQAKLQASSAADQAFDHVLSLLGIIQRSKQPPDLPKAESYCLEREQVIGRICRGPIAGRATRFPMECHRSAVKSIDGLAGENPANAGYSVGTVVIFGDEAGDQTGRKSGYKRPRWLDASLVSSNKRLAASTKNLSAPLGIPFHLADRNQGPTTAPLRFIIC